MPPTLALVLTLGFISYLFWRDVRERPNVTGALWLPVVWVFIICSRTLSQWLNLFGVTGFASSSIEEGSTLDAVVLSAMIVSAIFVLRRRQISLSEIARENKWLVILILYCLLSALWSDSAFTSVKRWIKMLGHPIMLLVVFTEPEPEEAWARLMKRASYVLFPISILWMKYYPAFGRRYETDGALHNVGITVTKNELGVISIIFGLFFFWYVLQAWPKRRENASGKELLISLGLLSLTGYCLAKAHSATSVLSLLLGAIIMLSLGLRFVDKERVGIYAVTSLLAVLTAQGLFDVFGHLVELTGHSSTLEGRGHLWEVVLATDHSPILGAGYESYWSGERLQSIWSMPEFWWKPIQAHNGYIEVYLNLGIVGVTILVGVLLVAFKKCAGELIHRFEWGRLMMSYWAMLVVHNWTEAGFKGLSLMFFVFFCVAIKLPRHVFSASAMQPFLLEEANNVVYGSVELEVPSGRELYALSGSHQKKALCDLF